jgi:hypothetical protein
VSTDTQAFEVVAHDLRALLRQAQGKNARPSAAFFDSLFFNTQLREKTMTAPTFLRKLQNDVSNFGPYWRQVELWVKEGEFDILRNIVQTLLDGAKTPAQKWNRDAIIRRLVGDLALTPRWESAAFLFEIHAMLEFVDFEMNRDLSQNQRPITLSSLLAAGQEATLHRLFEHFGNDERHHMVLALLAQEMVLRGHRVINTPVESFWQSKVVAPKHPLKWLPLRLVAQEQNISDYLPTRSATGMMCTMPFHGFDQTQTELEGESHLQVVPRPVDEERFVNLLQEPENGGNRSFVLARYFVESLSPPTEFSVADLLRLDFEWFQSAQACNLNLRSATPTQAFEFLFYTASMSGCYGVEAGGAWGRLRAWKAMGELVEAPENAALEEIADLSSRFIWSSFIADTDWFVGLGPDFGLIAIASDAKHLVVLASTDCD